jgi:hypothetical protein
MHTTVVKVLNLDPQEVETNTDPYYIAINSYLAKLDGLKYEGIAIGWVREDDGVPLVARVPQYTHDLNAVHELVQKLNKATRHNYEIALIAMTRGWGGAIDAPALMRCEAIVLATSPYAPTGVPSDRIPRALPPAVRIINTSSKHYRP